MIYTRENKRQDIAKRDSAIEKLRKELDILDMRKNTYDELSQEKDVGYFDAAILEIHAQEIKVNAVIKDIKRSWL